MDETIYVIFKVQFDFALEVWFSIFSIRQFRLIKCSFFMHSTTPCIHPRLDSLIDPKFSNWFQDFGSYNL